MRSEQSFLLALKNKEQELRAIIGGAKAILRKTSFADSARAIFDECSQLVGVTSGYIALLSDDGSENEGLFS